MMAIRSGCNRLRTIFTLTWLAGLLLLVGCAPSAPPAGTALTPAASPTSAVTPLKTTPPPPPSGLTPPVASLTPSATLTQPTVPALPLANVTCNQLSFYLDPALGSGYDCDTVPESASSDIPMDIFIYPAHTELTLQNYPLTRTQFPPQVSIYPVKRFSELLPDVIPRRVSDLERFNAGGVWRSEELPFLPPLPMEQTFFSHATVLSFNGGQGVRFITDYNESRHPISNRTLFYTFQGLTADGMYWVAVTLPISSPILPADADFHTLPEGYTTEGWFQDRSPYVREVKDALEAQAPASFFPTLNSLDSLVRSITVLP